MPDAHLASRPDPEKVGQRKGLLLAGGAGRRLHPMTLPVSKHLLPIYDKPMIYYPLGVLMLAGIREIAVVTTPRDRPAFEALLGEGSRWGLQIEFLEQPEPRGIAEGLVLAEPFLDGTPSMVILGDNFLYGAQLIKQLRESAAEESGAGIFGYRVRDPRAFGVVTVDENLEPLALVEKPRDPPSPWAIVGLYLLDGSAPERARRLTPSPRGELEMTDLLRGYLDEGTLRLELLGRGISWLDTGTPQNLLNAAHFVQLLQERQGLRVGAPEEIAFRMGYIDRDALCALADELADTEYGEDLRALAASDPRTR